MNKMQEEADMVRMLVSFYTPNSWTAATWLCTTVAKTISIKHDLLGMQRDGPLLGNIKC